MRIGPFGMMEIMIILTVLLLFGAHRLPATARGIAQAVREFKRGIRDTGEEPTSSQEQEGHVHSTGSIPLGGVISRRSPSCGYA